MIAALISVFGFGISNAIGKKLSVDLSPRRGLVVRGVALLVVSLPLLFFVDVQPVTYTGVMRAVMIAIVGYFPILFLYEGLRKGYVGIVVPLANTRSVLTLLLSAALLDILITPMQWVAMGMLVIAAVGISIPAKHTGEVVVSSHQSVLYGSLAAVFWGVTFFLFTYSVAAVGPVWAAYITEIVVVVCAMVHMHMVGERYSITDVTKVGYGYALLTGFLSACGSFGFMFATDAIGIAYATAIGALSPAIAAVVGFWYFKEPWNLRQLCAIVLGCVGLVLLALQG